MKTLEVGTESFLRCQHVGITLSQWKNTLNMNEWQVFVGNIFPVWSDRVPKSERSQGRQTFK